MKKLALFCGLFLLFSKALLAQTNQSGIVRVGAAQVDITPPLGVPMAGYYTPRGMTGVHDPLYAKALAIDDGSTKAVMLVCDLISIKKSLSTEVRKAIGREFGIPESNITVTSTHSHTGPVLTPDYIVDIIPRTIESARKAIAAMQPARIMAGTGTENMISFNRRFLMRDGTVRFNPGIQNPDIIRTMGPIDPMVGILYFETLSGKPLATWVNFALHLDTIGGTESSADYPYFVGQILKRLKGDDMVVMFANGTCGDINHINVFRKEQYETRFGKAEQLGHALAGEVIKQYPSLALISSNRVAAAHEIVPLAVPEYTAAELEEAKSISERPFTGGAATPVIRTAMRKLSTMKYLKEYSVDALPAEVQVIAIGPVAIVYLPGEVFVELGLAIKKRSPFPYTFVVELTEDSISYIPTKRAFDEGSYEVEVSWIKAGEAEKMVESAVRLLNKLRDVN